LPDAEEGTGLASRGTFTENDSHGDILDAYGSVDPGIGRDLDGIGLMKKSRWREMPHWAEEMRGPRERRGTVTYEIAVRYEIAVTLKRFAITITRGYRIVESAKQN
jgi:hypothetical protein